MIRVRIGFSVAVRVSDKSKRVVDVTSCFIHLRINPFPNIQL
jgi:hypothetical protein